MDSDSLCLEKLFYEFFFSDTGIEEMSSVLSGLKQIPTGAGYYVPVGDCVGKFYLNTSGSDSAPIFNGNLMVSTMSSSGAYVSSLINGAGKGVFRDHGKTLVSSGRVFRKVQLMISSASLTQGGTSGVGGLADGSGVTGNSQPSGYLTGYIELPGLAGAASGNFTANTITPVARLG
jgi:hypothetical protein